MENIWKNLEDHNIHHFTYRKIISKCINIYGNISLILYRNYIEIISKYGKHIWKDDSFPRIGGIFLGEKLTDPDRLRSQQFLFVEPPVVLQLPRDSYRNPACVAWKCLKPTTKTDQEPYKSPPIWMVNIAFFWGIVGFTRGLPWVYHGLVNHVNFCMGTI